MPIKLRPATQISDNGCTNTRLNSSIKTGSKGGTHHLDTRISTVRDYRDYYVLSILQQEAVRECPGFRELEDGEDAKIMWIRSEKRWIPAGYYIFSRRCIRQVRCSERPVVYPLTLHQIFIIPRYRGLGLGTMMLRDFIAQGNRRTIWIESPFDVTKHILEKLGYAETEEPYELWQMMEGLSKWGKLSSRSTNRIAVPARTIDIENCRHSRSQEDGGMASA